MKLKRLLSMLVATAMTVGMMSFTVLADEAENAPEETGVVETTEAKVPVESDKKAAKNAELAGDKLTWTYDEATKTLTISGSGKMYNFAVNGQPWYSHKSDIIKVIISKGVTSIGDEAFHGYPNIESVSIPKGVTSIGQTAFKQCRKLKNISFPDSLKTIGNAEYKASDWKTVTVTIKIK